MAFERISEEELAGVGVELLPDLPELAPDAMKAKFEETAKKLLAPKHNKLAEQMEAETAAANLGAEVPGGLDAETARTVQAVLTALMLYIQAHEKRKNNPHAVTAEQVGAYTKEQTDNAIADKIVEIGSSDMQSAVYDPQRKKQDIFAYTDRAAKETFAKIPNPNLLDNSNFVNAVNQRGQASYTSDGYTIDRWRIKNCEYTVKTQQLKLTPAETDRASAQMYEYVQWEKLWAEGDHLTLSAKINGAIFTVTGVFPAFEGESACFAAVDISDTCELAMWRNSDESKASIAIQTKEDTSTQETLTLEWVKLEKASIATPYVPKLYSDELLACAWYYQRFTQWISPGVGSVAWNGSNVSLQVDTILHMRTTPSIVISGNGNVGITCNGTSVNLTVAPRLGPYIGCTLQLVFNQTFENSLWNQVAVLNTNDAVIELSADL